MLVPEGATSTQLRTDDPGPLHAAAGYEIDIDGVTFEVWRTMEQPPSSASSRMIDGQWLWSTGPVPELALCLAESLTYDQVADAADD